MKIATNRDPVSISHPTTGSFLVVKRGDEFTDDDPIATDPGTAWLFAEVEDRGPVLSTPIEDASARPGAVRRTPRSGR